MTISSPQTLIVFFSMFGIIGSLRGPSREVWTLGGISLTLALFTFAGQQFFSQLPLRLGAGAMSLIGNQAASDSINHQELSGIWANLLLLAGLTALIALSYYMGNHFGGKAPPKDFGEHVAGFILGALNGTFIASSSSARVSSRTCTSNFRPRI